MKDELRAYLSLDRPERLARANAFLSETEEPSADLGEILLESRINAAERFDSKATAQSLWLVRLSGEGIEDGWIDQALEEAIVGPLSREVEHAAPAGARQESRIGLVGVSTGSVLLHFRPRSPKRTPELNQLSYDTSPADAAILRVSQLHDLLERQAPAPEIAGIFGNDQALLKQARALVTSLSANGVNLSTRWWSSTSARSTSRLTTIGQQHALTVFKTTIAKEVIEIAGMVTALDIRGVVTVTGASEHRYPLKVGPEAVVSERFALGVQVRVLARQEHDVDKAGVRSRHNVYTFIQHVENSSLFDGDDVYDG